MEAVAAVAATVASVASVASVKFKYLDFYYPLRGQSLTSLHAIPVLPGVWVGWTQEDRWRSTEASPGHLYPHGWRIAGMVIDLSIMVNENHNQLNQHKFQAYVDT